VELAVLRPAVEQAVVRPAVEQAVEPPVVMEQAQRHELEQPVVEQMAPAAAAVGQRAPVEWASAGRSAAHQS
jgi:hypothetical protein